MLPWQGLMAPDSLTLIVVNHSLVVLNQCLQLLDLDVAGWTCPPLGEASLEGNKVKVLTSSWVTKDQEQVAKPSPGSYSESWQGKPHLLQPTIGFLREHQGGSSGYDQLK